MCKISSMIEEIAAIELQRPPYEAEKVRVVRRGESLQDLAKNSGIEQFTCSDIDKKIFDYLERFARPASLEIGTAADGRPRVLLFVPVAKEYILVILKVSRAEEDEKESVAGIDYYYIREIEKRLLDWFSNIPEGVSKSEGRVLYIAKDVSLVEFRTETGDYTIQFPTRRLIRAQADNIDCRVKHLVYEMGTKVVSDLQAVEGQKRQSFSWDDLEPLTTEIERQMRDAEGRAGE